MAEIKSAQAVKLASVPLVKLETTEYHGRLRVFFAAMPAVFAAPAINDTILLGKIPAKSRILGGKLTCAAGTASSTLDIGVRKAKDQTVISATGITAAVDTAAAGTKDVLTGALVSNGLSYVTNEDVEVYATVKGAVLAANQVLSLHLTYVLD